MKKLILAALAALSLATACNLDVDSAYIGAEYLNVLEAGGSFDAPLYATGPWTATVSAPEDMKMSINPSSGTGDTQITITVAPYSGEDEYTFGYIIIDCGKSKVSFPVYQYTQEYWEKLQQENNVNY